MCHHSTELPCPDFFPNVAEILYYFIWFKGNHLWLACECAGSYSPCCMLAFVCPGLIIHLIPVLDFTREEMNMEGINSWQKGSGLESGGCWPRVKFIIKHLYWCVCTLHFLLHCFKLWMSSISKTQISPTYANTFTSEGGHLLLNGWTVKYGMNINKSQTKENNITQSHSKVLVYTWVLGCQVI